MKRMKLTVHFLTLIAFLFVNNFITNAPAQKPVPLPKRCNPVADQIYFVDSGQMVSVLHPGPNGDYGYQLNIIGSQVDKFVLGQDEYMKSVSLVFKTDTQAKWQIYFHPKMARSIASVKLSSTPCTPRGFNEFPLTEKVELANQ